MPKEEPKKKVVVVEEVEVEESSAVKETPVEKESKPDSVPTVETVASNEISEIEEYEDKPNYLWIIVPTALLVGALVGGLITYFSGLSRLELANSTPSPIASSVPEATETPSASSAPTLKRESVKLQILNGSGVSGAAGKAKTLLEGLGYTSIETGNASSSDFATTEVSAKEASKEFIELLIKDLSKNYEATAAAKVLPSSSKYDIVITLGKK